MFGWGDERRVEEMEREDSFHKPSVPNIPNRKIKTHEAVRKPSGRERFGCYDS